MTLSPKAQRILRYNIQWPRINVTTLHEDDIQRLERCFKYLMDHDMEYEINEMDAFLNMHFMGVHERTQEHILDIAKEIKYQLPHMEPSPPTVTDTHRI